MYGPQYLLDKDVVLVVTNYRLAALGKYSESLQVEASMQALCLIGHWHADPLLHGKGTAGQYVDFVRAWQ